MIAALWPLPLPWPFEREYMQLALFAGLVVGASAPLIGTFLVQKRLSLIGDGLGHVAFAGVAVGLLLHLAPLWTAMVAAVGAGIAIEWLRTHGHGAGDLVLALFLYTGIAGGVVATSAAGSYDASVLGYLFGAILTVSPGDVALIVGLGVGVVALMAVAWRALFAVVLDEASARVGGLPVDTLNLGLAAVTAVTVVAAMRVVGVLLVAALMVLPVGAAQQVARSFRETIVLAVAAGIASVVLGLTASRLWDLAPGGTVVLAAGLLFVVASGLAAARGARRALAVHH